MKFIDPYKLFMGALVPNWLMQRKEVTSTAKLLYGRLIEYWGRNRKAFPSQKTLAQEIGITDRQVRNCLSELEECGLIYIDRSNKGHVNSYFFPAHPWMHSTLGEKEIEGYDPQRGAEATQETDFQGGRKSTSYEIDSNKRNKQNKTQEGNNFRHIYEQVKQKNPFVDFPSLDWIKEQYHRFKERNPESPVKLSAYIKAMMENIAIKARKEVPSEGAMEGG